jgi:hypothetical protein
MMIEVGNVNVSKLTLLRIRCYWQYIYSIRGTRDQVHKFKGMNKHMFIVLLLTQTKALSFHSQ